MRKISLILVVLSLWMGVVLGVEKEEGKLSPYFFVENKEDVEALPLLGTKVDVNIAGVIAGIKLKQIYKNQGNKTIEAIYVFPLTSKSAINAMRMKIGDRTIEAEIEEKEAAQKIYQSAKNNGQTVSLLQQERPNVFQMKVANIMPGDIVEVIVDYTELLIPDEGVYEFVYPTVVGPRYTGEAKDQTNDTWTNTPYLHQGKTPTSTININARIKAGIPLENIWVPTHKVAISKKATGAKVALLPEEANGGNRDFILRYTLKGKEIQTGLLLYPGIDENFFLLMAQPPRRVSSDEIAPREYTFIVDVSGSMHGFPLDISKNLMEKILRNLNNRDYFNILFFAGGSNVLSEYPLEANEANIEKALNMLKNQRGGGGTNMLLALNRALSLEKKEGLSRTVVMITDGYVPVEKKTFDLIREKLGEANFFTFGIGSSVNRYLIEGLARVGCGEPFIVTNQKEGSLIVDKFFKYVSSPILTDIKIKTQGFEIYDLEPLSPGDLFAEKPLIVYGKYKNPRGKIIITGITSSGDYKKVIKVNSSYEDKKNSSLKYLWAREKVASLCDYAKVGVNTKDQVIELGLKYSLITEFTSFVAVDTVVRDTGESVTVKQPLPLPQGVSDYAVGDQSMSGYAASKCQRLYSPMVSLKCKEELDVDRLVKTRQDKKISSIYLVSGKFPKGISMIQIEKKINSLKNELIKLFDGGEISSIKIKLYIKSGRVQKLDIIFYKGKECKEAELLRVFKKLDFGSNLTDSLEIELNYL